MTAAGKRAWWYSSEVGQLRKLARQGLPAADIAERMDKSLNAVHGQAARAGISIKHTRAVWTGDELVQLSDLMADGYTRRAAAEKLGRTLSAVHETMHQLGLKNSPPPKVHLFSLKIAEDTYLELARIARERGLAVGRLARMILQLIVKTPGLLTKLLDELSPERNSADDVLVPLKPVAATQVNVHIGVVNLLFATIHVPSHQPTFLPQPVLALPSPAPHLDARM